MTDNSSPTKKIKRTVSFNNTVDIKEFNLEDNIIQESSILKEDIKTVDGISLVSYIVDNIMYDYFQIQHITTVYDVAKSIENSFDKYTKMNSDAVITLNREIVLEVKNYIERTCDKINNTSPYENIPVLNSGGGRGVRLQMVNMAHLYKLISFIDKFMTDFA